MRLTPPPFPKPDIEDFNVLRSHRLQWERFEKFQRLKSELRELMDEYKAQYLHAPALKHSLMPREEWLEKAADLQRYSDSYGNPYKDGYCMDVAIYADSPEDLPGDATHVMWYWR